MKNLTFIFLILLIGTIGIADCFGAMTSVQSGTDSNGVYFYSVTSGDESLTFGGQGILAVRIPSKEILETFSTEGWTSAVSENVALWFCTNDNARIADQPTTFSLRSAVSDWTTYDVTSDTYPAGYVFGSVYYTNGNLYTTDSGTNGMVASENIAGYESFGFIGPVVPEPMLLWLTFISLYIPLRSLRALREKII